jgi:hypothetical protein
MQTATAAKISIALAVRSSLLRSIMAALPLLRILTQARPVLKAFGGSGFRKMLARTNPSHSWSADADRHAFWSRSPNRQR